MDMKSFFGNIGRVAVEYQDMKASNKNRAKSSVAKKNVASNNKLGKKNT